MSSHVPSKSSSTAHGAIGGLVALTPGCSSRILGPVAAARSGDGPEGCLLSFRGAERLVAAVTEEGGARRLTRLRSEEHGGGLQAKLPVPSRRR